MDTGGREYGERLMSSIRILPDRVANQIAAGEVVERPAAVVKELVENSIDAGATRIEIEYRNGGKSYLRVEDDGKGMNRDEALLCLERHATSKIREADDLDNVLSFGFRGEALPSIASVSRFTLRTRCREAEGGQEVFVNGGKIIRNQACGMPEGTRIEVAQLFNSVPARRKFLKTDATEAAHICHLARLYALAHPEISFTLLEGMRTIFRSPACEDLSDRVREIFGSGLAECLATLEAEEQEDDLRLGGLMAKPGAGRSTRKEMLFFVNKRPVESKTLSYALIEAYHGYVPKGRYPPAAIFLQIPPAAVDVNIHPAKRELRFRDEGKVRGFIIRAVLDRLRQLTGDAPPAETRSAPLAPLPRLDLTALPRGTELPALTSSGADDQATASPASVPSSGLPAAPFRTSRPPETQTKPQNQESPTARKRVGYRDDLDASWRFLGRPHGDLALFATPAGIVALHCRAAYERVLFEQVEEQASAERPTESQTLLLPEALELDGVDSENLAAFTPELNSRGFQVEEFGRNFYRVEACPPWLEPAEAVGFLRDFLDLVREAGGGSASTRIAREELTRLAVVRGSAAADEFADGEIVGLAEKLLACRNPLTCPKGHPTYLETPKREWEKRFGRSL